MQIATAAHRPAIQEGSQRQVAITKRLDGGCGSGQNLIPRRLSFGHLVKVRIIAMHNRLKCFCQDKNAANINEKVQCPAEPQPSKEPKRKGEQAIQEDTPVSRCALRFSEPEATQVHPAGLALDKPSKSATMADSRATVIYALLSSLRPRQVA